jgi:hypothetical protein
VGIYLLDQQQHLPHQCLCSLKPHYLQQITDGEELTESSTQTGLNYYPNPTQGKFILKVTEDLLNTEFLITDMNGKNIMKGSATQLENSIDLTDQPSGVYYITLQGKGKVIREKLIIL